MQSRRNRKNKKPVVYVSQPFQPVCCCYCFYASSNIGTFPNIHLETQTTSVSFRQSDNHWFLCPNSQPLTSNRLTVFPYLNKSIPRCQLEQLLSIVDCSIVSTSKNSQVDAYVLSESSMFISKRRFILKTCGNTTPLDCIDNLTKERETKKKHLKYYMYLSINVYYSSMIFVSFILPLVGRSICKFRYRGGNICGKRVESLSKDSLFRKFSILERIFKDQNCKNRHIKTSVRRLRFWRNILELEQVGSYSAS